MRRAQTSRIAFLSRSSVTYSDGRFAVYARKQQSRAAARRYARFERRPRFPCHARADRPRTGRREHRQRSRLRPGPAAICTFEQQVIEDEGEVERRIAIPRAFSIEKNGPFRADQDVLRTEIAMDQRAPRGDRGGGHQCACSCGATNPACAACGGHQIGVEPHAPGTARRSESAPRCRAGRRWRHGCGPSTSHPPAAAVRVSGAVAFDQQFFPDRIFRRRQARLIAKAPATAVLAQDLRHRARHDSCRPRASIPLPSDCAPPAHAPVCGDLEAGQRTFDANDAGSGRSAR